MQRRIRVRQTQLPCRCLQTRTVAYTVMTRVFTSMAQAIIRPYALESLDLGSPASQCTRITERSRGLKDTPVPLDSNEHNRRCQDANSAET